LSIASRRADASTARELVLEGGKKIDDRAIARGVGTTVRVEDLFFNTPARKKFMKSVGAETAHCWQTLHRLALGSPEVQFEAWQDGEKIFHYPATSSREERIVQVYKEAWKLNLEVEDLLLVKAESFPLKLHAWILPTKHFIPSSRGILTFVNGRSVKDKLLQQAILAAAKETLFGRTYPQLVLDLEMPAGYVDVNVHPTKAEVRFREPGHIFGFLRKHLERALANDRRGSVSFAVAEEEDRAPHFAAPEFSANPALLFGQAPTQFHQRATDAPGFAAMGNEPAARQAFAPEHGQAFAPEAGPAFTPAYNHSAAPEFSSAIRAADSAAQTKRPQFLGTLRNTYLVCQDDEGLLLVDQHAAHERVTYEKLKRNRLAKREGAPLLIPIQVELPRNALDRIEGEFPKFAEWGLSLDRTGPTIVAVRELPALLLRADGSPVLPIGEFLRKLCQSWEEMPAEGQLADALLEKMLEVIASESCHGSVRAGRSLAPQEAVALLQQMSDTDFSGHCPHGRPTTLRFKWGEIERMFKRTL
jgi:DNA mismatch repair protein MutL